eukprot:GGOE01031733.1.p1 GENE.GGOE01031733.1~~GGOE01031733.1.p1  ORF type:complete len:220 (+),score=12.47 GGOE01031733.1:560-1219(+)
MDRNCGRIRVASGMTGLRKVECCPLAKSIQKMPRIGVLRPQEDTVFRRSLRALGQERPQQESERVGSLVDPTTEWVGRWAAWSVETFHRTSSGGNSARWQVALTNAMCGPKRRREGFKEVQAGRAEVQCHANATQGVGQQVRGGRSVTWHTVGERVSTSRIGAQPQAVTGTTQHSTAQHTITRHLWCAGGSCRWGTESNTLLPSPPTGGMKSMFVTVCA